MIEVRSSSSNTADTGTDVTVSAPSEIIAGDVVIVFVHANGLTTIVDNNGSTPFTEDLNDYQPNTVNGHTVSVFSRRMQDGDPATYSFTIGTSDRWSVIAVAIKSPNSSAIFEISPSSTYATNVDDSTSGDATTASITTLTHNVLHIIWAGWDTSADGTITTPSGYTTIQSVPGGEPSHASYKRIPSPQATGTKVISNTEFGARMTLSFSLLDTTKSSLYIRKYSRPRPFAPGIAK